MCDAVDIECPMDSFNFKTPSSDKGGPEHASPASRFPTWPRSAGFTSAQSKIDVESTKNNPKEYRRRG